MALDGLPTTAIPIAAGIKAPSLDSNQYLMKFCRCTCNSIQSALHNLLSLTCTSLAFTAGALGPTISHRTGRTRKKTWRAAEAAEASSRPTVTISAGTHAAGLSSKAAGRRAPRATVAASNTASEVGEISVCHKSANILLRLLLKPVIT